MEIDEFTLYFIMGFILGIILAMALIIVCLGLMTALLPSPQVGDWANVTDLYLTYLVVTP